MEKRFNQKKLLKIASCVVLVILILFSGMIFFSPYGNAEGFSYKLIKNEITINAPLDSVYKFLGNSGNTPKWSVYVDHITPLNPEEFKDGTVGSRRRCFCYPDERGRRWDELITEVVPLKKRQLIIYNMIEFPLEAEGLATEQNYEKLDERSCKLIFLVFYKDKKPGFAELIKTYFAAYFISDIFEKNMENIKRVNESGAND